MNLSHSWWILHKLWRVFRRTILEAALCGRPVLATDTGSAREVVEEGVTGFLAPLGSQGLYAAMERAWDKRKDWEKMGQCLRERIFNLQGDNDSLHECFYSWLD